MELIGQSLEVWRPPLAAALRDRDPAPLRTRARRQLATGATALDLNAGVRGSAGDLRWLATVVREVAPDIPLLLDSGDEAALAEALDGYERDSLAPLIANAAVAGGPGERRLFEAAASAGAGIVLSPRGIEMAGAADAAAAAERIVETLIAGIDRARAAAVGGPRYLDALAHPPATDAARCARSLDVLRALRSLPAVADATPLVAVGNVGHGTTRRGGPALRAALRLLYAVAATGAGARALILPVEQRGLLEAVALAAGKRPPSDDRERWLAALATAAGEGAAWPGPPPGATHATHAEREAWALLKP